MSVSRRSRRSWRPVSVKSGEQDEDQLEAVAITSAILHRYDPKKFKFENGGERYSSFSLLELGRNWLERRASGRLGMSRNRARESGL